MGDLQAVLPALASLIALQKLDSAAQAARDRIDEFPAAELALADAIAAAEAVVETARTKVAENHDARLSLEKDVAEVDTRLARFEDHKAAVKTNQAFTALLHEIETAKSEKDRVEEQILVLMEEGDALAAGLKRDESSLGATTRDADAAGTAMADERTELDAEIVRLTGARKGEVGDVEGTVLARYDRLVSQRRGVAVARIVGETCSACQMRLRPHVEQMIRRNEEIIQCESCQRILFYEPPADA
jgi:predicted  nucleic acid-binding Zn-ribbon protein